LVRHVHGGAFGQVWIGRHDILGNRCAVKVFPDNRVGRMELEGVRRYKMVADRQDGLVPIQEVGSIPGKGFYYTMPLADDVSGWAVVRDAAEYEAMTLQRYCEMHRPLPIDRVLSVALQLLPSLHALHEAGLVHRDIKPANIVRIEGAWKCCDVGLVARRDEIASNCGTHGFVPPEGVRDRRADLFALGVTLYLLATDHSLAQFEEFREGRLTIPGGDNRRSALQEFIKRACNPDPTCRFQTALEMCRAVNDLVRTTKVTVVLDDDFATFTQSRLDDFLRAVRERGFHVFGVPVCEEGSVRITLEVAADQAEKLVEAVESGVFSSFRTLRAEVPGVRMTIATGMSAASEKTSYSSRWEDDQAQPARTHELEESVTPLPEPAGSGCGEAVLPAVPGYEVLEVLGRGGLDIVYRARQLALNRVVALKSSLEWVDVSFGERFRAGVEAQARLQHPNIEQVIEWGRIDDKWYYSTELCSGGNLSDRQRSGAVTAPQAIASLVATLAEALEAVHRAGVIHRDLKPVNILFTQEGTPKISSFECALTSENRDQQIEGSVVGTPAYMAPEQTQGQVKAITPACDIFGLGGILFECLTGRAPFRGNTVGDTLLLVGQCELTPPSHINPRCPPDLQAICMKCLAKNPSDRYTGAADLAEDLNRFIRGEEVVARPASGLERLWRLVRRSPAWTAVVALSVIVAVLTGLLLWRT
jgi:serine/threonine protein kinase